MWPGHRALRYNLMSASTGNKDMGEMGRTGISSQQYSSFLWQGIAIPDDPGAGSQSMIHDPKIVTSLNGMIRLYRTMYRVHLYGRRC